MSYGLLLVFAFRCKAAGGAYSQTAKSKYPCNLRLLAVLFFKSSDCSKTRLEVKTVPALLSSGFGIIDQDLFCCPEGSEVSAWGRV